MARISAGTVIGIVGLLLAVMAGCNVRPVLSQLVEARQITSDLRLQFAKATDAANMAVMADTDDAAAASARDAEAAKRAVEKSVERLRPLLQSLGYPAEQQALDAFAVQFAEYLEIDGEILPLAIENSNLKAQRLLFGPARERGDAFRTALDIAVQLSGEAFGRLPTLAAQAEIAALDVMVRLAPHIAEADDGAMTQMESQMTASLATADRHLQEMRPLLSIPARARYQDAVGALEQFKSITREIIALSRRNSEVRSLALSLGRKRTIAAACDDRLRVIEEALAKHEFIATR